MSDGTAGTPVRGMYIMVFPNSWSFNSWFFICHMYFLPYTHVCLIR
jgi:hypothetical protein